jgi:hypothetical protein
MSVSRQFILFVAWKWLNTDLWKKKSVAERLNFISDTVKTLRKPGCLSQSLLNDLPLFDIILRYFSPFILED